MAVSRCNMSQNELHALIAARPKPDEPSRPNFWKEPLFPHPDNDATWTSSEMTDDGEDCEGDDLPYYCQMCGYKPIRYLHKVSAIFRFPDGIIARVELPNVGSCCSDNLTRTKTARKEEGRRRRALQKEQRTRRMLSALKSVIEVCK